MITKIPEKGSYPLGLLYYLTQGRGSSWKLLDKSLSGDSIESYARQIERVAWTYRHNQVKFVKHIILSFAPGEELPDEKLREILAFYLERMGYRDAPFVAYLHTDTPQPHIHIVTTPTTWRGQAISESWDWPRSERAARAIEKKWGLQVVRSSPNAELRAPTQKEIHSAARSGGDSARRRFQVQVSEAAFQARRLPEFLERLAGEGIEARVLLDREGRLRGISFGAGEVRFKGSQLGRDFKGGNLLTAFGMDYDPARDREAVERFRNPPRTVEPGDRKEEVMTQREGRSAELEGWGGGSPGGSDRAGGGSGEGRGTGPAMAGPQSPAPAPALGGQVSTVPGDDGRLLPWEEPVELRRHLQAREQKVDRELARLRRELWAQIRRKGRPAPGTSGTAERYLPVSDRARAAVEAVTGEPLPRGAYLAAGPEEGWLELRVPGSASVIADSPSGKFRMRNSRAEGGSAVPERASGDFFTPTPHAQIPSTQGFTGTTDERFRMRNSGVEPGAGAPVPSPGPSLHGPDEGAVSPSVPGPSSSPGEQFRMRNSPPEAPSPASSPPPARPAAPPPDPRLDALSELLASSHSVRPIYATSLTAERLALARDLAALESRPGTAARDLESLPRPTRSQPLPPGRYQLTAVAPEALESSRRLGRSDLVWVRRGWGLEQIDRARRWLARENRQRSLLVRPEVTDRTLLGFRNLTREQVESLRRDGLEPAWLVRRGARYDLLLQAHERLSPPETVRLREELAREYGLPVQGGVFQDAVALPGSAVVPGAAAGRAELVERRDEPFSASRRLVARIRLWVEEAEISRIARRVELPEGADALPDAVLAETAQERPAYPEGAPLAGVQRRVEAQARSGEGAAAEASRGLADARLYARAEKANRELIELAAERLREPGQEVETDGRREGDGRGPTQGEQAGEQLPSPAELETSPPAERLYAVEGEIARRRSVYQEELARAEERLAQATARLDQVVARFESRPDAGLIETYREAADAFGQAAQEHREAEGRYLAATVAQYTLDRQRYAAALLVSDDEAAHEAYGRLLTRELVLARRAGLPVEPGVGAEASAGRLRRHLDRLAGRVAEARERLREEGLAALEAFQRLRRDEIVSRLFLARAEQREAGREASRGAEEGQAKEREPSPPGAEAPGAEGRVKEREPTQGAEVPGAEGPALERPAPAPPSAPDVEAPQAQASSPPSAQPSSSDPATTPGAPTPGAGSGSLGEDLSLSQGPLAPEGGPSTTPTAGSASPGPVERQGRGVSTETPAPSSDSTATPGGPPHKSGRPAGDVQAPRPGADPPPTDPDQALADLLSSKAALEQRGQLETALEAGAADPRDRLQQAALRVASGDLSSQGLRRLNTEILASRLARDLTVPTFQLPGRPVELYERYRLLGQEVQKAAAGVAQAGTGPGTAAGDAAATGASRAAATGAGSGPSSEQLGQLFQLSSELVALQRRLETLERRLLRIADPGPAPEGVSQLAWNVAWLERAAEKGLLPPANTVHLVNAPRAPVIGAGFFTPGRVAFAAYWLGRWAFRKAWNWTRRVLSQ